MMYTETRKRHEYYFYGRVLSGYGPSMDPHHCGDESEPCRTIIETREVTSWQVSRIEKIGTMPGEDRD